MAGNTGNDLEMSGNIKRANKFGLKLKQAFLILIFLLIFKFLNLAIGGVLHYYKYFYQPDMHSLTWRDFYNKGKNTVDVLFLGSSHSRFAFDTRIFDKNLEVNTFNLSSSGQTPLVGYYALKEALKYQKPKVLVYETYWRIIGTTDNITPAYFVYDYIKGYDTKIDILFHVWNEKNFSSFLAQSLSKTYKYRDSFIPAVKSICKRNIIKPQRTSEFIDFTDFTYYGDGFFGSKTVAGYDKLYKNNSFRTVGASDFKLDPTQIEYLKKSMELCKENNIPVIMVTAPLPIPSMDFIKDYNKYHNKLSDIAKGYGIDYLDYNQINIETHEFSNDFFYDTNHLNMNSAAYLDNLLTPVLKDYLK